VTLALSIHADVKAITSSLRDLARKQIPYATARALNGLAKRAVVAEQTAMKAQLDRPTPFTLRGISFMRATKANLTATMFIKDIQARYLAPEIVGGKQVLGRGRAILVPAAGQALLNVYGNLPRGALARLRGKANIFIGSITVKGSHIGGVWQRIAVAKGDKSGVSKRRGTFYSKEHGLLKLLIRFSDPKEVRVRYRWGDAVRKTVNSTAVAEEFNAALAKALATAR
jgi:hypothetical protein